MFYFLQAVSFVMLFLSQHRSAKLEFKPITAWKDIEFSYYINEDGTNVNDDFHRIVSRFQFFTAFARKQNARFLPPTFLRGSVDRSYRRQIFDPNDLADGETIPHQFSKLQSSSKTHRSLNFDVTAADTLLTLPKESQLLLSARDGKAYDYFGNRVASNGQFIAVATKSERLGGKVYLFTQSDSLLPPPYGNNGNTAPLPPHPLPPSQPIIQPWKETAQLKSPGAVFDGFGDSIAISNDFLIVAAPYDSNNSGCVYIFSIASLSVLDYARYSVLQQPKAASFGFALSLYQSTLLVGSPHDNYNAGAVYLYQLDPLKSR